MASQNDNSERRLVPRWRYWNRIIINSEFSGDPRGRPAHILPSTVTKEAILNWQRTPTIITAADAITTATAYGIPDKSRDAANFLLENQSRTTPDIISLAKWISNNRNDQSIDRPILNVRDEARQIAHLSRYRLSQTPRNISARLDLSLAYTVLGEFEKAWEEMRRALILCPDHRYVLRAATRLLVHMNRVDEAYSMVKQHPRTLHDPWLLSLELSLARILNIPVMYAKHARKLLLDLKNQPGFITELASATGMLEWRDGSHKRGRKLLQSSLIEPTDNVIAQAQWIATEKDLSFRVNPTILKNPGTMEANYFRAMAESRWKDALDQASDWEIDEPFSSRPAVAGSFVASALLGEHELAAQFAEMGLRSDGEDQLLRNNYVVALARAGKTDQAHIEFQKIQRPLQLSYPEFAYIATEGLLKFSIGEVEAGRNLYMQATEQSPRSNKLLVIVHWLETEACYSTARLNPDLEEAGNILRKNRDPIISAMATKVMNCNETRKLRESYENKISGTSSMLPQLIDRK